jgi:hypothetical protein
MPEMSFMINRPCAYELWKKMGVFMPRYRACGGRAHSHFPNTAVVEEKEKEPSSRKKHRQRRLEIYRRSEKNQNFRVRQKA